MKLGLLAFTEAGECVIKRISTSKDNSYTIYNKSTDTLKPWLSERFSDCDGIVFVGAIGIAVRLISPLIKSKDTDPAVVVIDEKGEYVIPILSGHIGGGNKLSIKLADLLSATPIITTATDINKKLAIDTWATENNAVVDNIDAIKHISSAVLRGDEVGFCSDFPIDNTLPSELTIKDSGELGVMVGLDNSRKPFDVTLNIIPRVVTLGMGCRKDTDPEKLNSFIRETLLEQKISLKSVRAIASIDLKENEKAILSFASGNDIETYFYTADELQETVGEFTQSEFVRATTGVDNVCERSAVLHSGGELILHKIAKDGMTIAIAKSIWRCRF